MNAATASGAPEISGREAPGTGNGNRELPGVLVVLGGMGPAGAERQARLLLEGLAPLGFRPHVACFRGPEAVFASLRDAGVRVHLLPRPRPRVWPLHVLRYLHGLVGTHRIAVVHAFLPAFAALTPCLRFTRPGLRVVTGRRSLIESIRPSELFWQRLTSRLADAIVANAAAVAASVEWHEGALGRRLRIIANGMALASTVSREERVNARRLWGLADDDFVVAYPAHFRRAKGHLHLSDVAARLASGFPRLRFLLAGDSDSNLDYRTNSRLFWRMVDERGVRDSFRYAGLVPDGRMVLAAADICLNLSEREGMSNTVMEAMALGLPVIATAVGGTPEVVQEGITGYLVGPGDTAAVAEALGRLLVDPDGCARMGERGRRRIGENFSVERMVRAYADLYRELMAR